MLGGDPLNVVSILWGDNDECAVHSVTWKVASACPVSNPAFVAEAFTWNVPTLSGMAAICQVRTYLPFVSVDCSQTCGLPEGSVPDGEV